MQKISGNTLLAYVGGLFLAGNVIYIMGKAALLNFGIIPYDGQLVAALIPTAVEVVGAGFAFMYFYTEGDPYKLSSLEKVG